MNKNNQFRGIAFSNFEKDEKVQYVGVSIDIKDNGNVVLTLTNDKDNNYNIDKVIMVDGNVKIRFTPKNLNYAEIIHALGDKAIKLPQRVVNNYASTIIDNTIRLMNVANYYNGDWIPNWQDDNEAKYSICTNYKSDKKEHSFFVITHTQINQSTVYFKRKEDAQAVIDNPDLVAILDNIFYND